MKSAKDYTIHRRGKIVKARNVYFKNNCNCVKCKDRRQQRIPNAQQELTREQLWSMGSEVGKLLTIELSQLESLTKAAEKSSREKICDKILFLA